MRHAVYTKDEKHPRSVFVIECDLDLLTACVKEQEIAADEIMYALRSAMAKINDAILKGKAKAKAEANEP